MIDIVGHAAYVLVALSYTVKDMLWLRVLAVLASILGIVYNYFAPAEPLWLVIGWSVVFLTVNLVWVVKIVRSK